MDAAAFDKMNSAIEVASFIPFFLSCRTIIVARSSAGVSTVSTSASIMTSVNFGISEGSGSLNVSAI